MSLVPDQRAQEYWDGTGWLGNAYGKVLATPGSAWDVYLLYKRGRSWSDVFPPKPDYWMHQLSGVTNAPHLNPHVLFHHTEQFLAK